MQYACTGTQIWYSYTYCGEGWACAGAKLTASALSCPDPTYDYFQDVEYKDQCTCSDEFESPKCTVGGAPSEEFCSSESAGVTCATLGNPICSGMPGYDNPTESDSAATSTSEPEGSTANSQATSPATSPPTSTTKVPIVAIVIPVVVAVIGLIAAVVNRKKIVHVVNHYKAGTGTKGAANP